MGGGVIANKFLRNFISKEIKSWDSRTKIFIPEKKFSTDNAAMIGVLSHYKNIDK
jgi:N6-L-threonylcarbamoyladenine synthase